MNRIERGRWRAACRDYAYNYLGVTRLPAGVGAIVRAYADSFHEYPRPSEWTGSPLRGLSGVLRPYRTVRMLA